MQTLLAARLDRLEEIDRAVAPAAAVCRPSVTLDAVPACADEAPSAPWRPLPRRELTRAGEPGEDGDEGWSFRHSLIRDVPYGSLPKWRRAVLHERLAECSIERGGEVGGSAGLH